jgi:hypothetical protein
MCVTRGTGAMNVYSMVPSQRSQAITSLMASKTMERKCQIRVPASRNMIRYSVSTVAPLMASMPAPMKVMARALAML